MTRALLVLAILAGIASPALAEKKLQVMQSDGRADAAVRTKIDAAVLALARTSGEQVVAADISFNDAAMAVGCKPDDAPCKDEVIGMLGVDELVITTVTPKPGGFEVAVRRVGKAGASRDAMSFVPADRVDRLDGFAPLFSTKPATLGPPVGPTPIGPTAPAINVSPAPLEPTPNIPPPSAAVEPVRSPIVTNPGPRDEDRPRGRRLQTIGMVGGGTLLLIGVILWGSASSVQDEIDTAPTNSKAELQRLQDLEAKGDAYAGVGNVFVLGGLVLGGVSTYYFMKSGRRRTSSARIVPAVFDRGGGLAIGGTL